MPRDTNTPAEPLVVAVFDTGKQGLIAEVYSLSAALDMAADCATGECAWQPTAMRYVDASGQFGEPVDGWEMMVREEVQERDRESIREGRGIFW